MAVLLNRAVVGAMVALVALATACGEGGPEETPSPGASPTAEHTSSAVPTETPRPSPASEATVPAVAASERAVVVRDSETFIDIGSLWVSWLDGGGRERLTDEGEAAKFAGVARHYETGNEMFYYVAVEGELARVMSGVADPETGERSQLLSFESFRRDHADAAVTPDGRYIAYAHEGGLDVLDLATGESRHLLDNGASECDVRTCMSHSRPMWSPDGKLLIVRRTFWEGGATVILDPFSEPVRFYAEGAGLGPWTSNWSPGGDAACGHSLYAEPSGLFLAEAPSWDFEDKLPHYANSYPVAPFVASCSWLSERLIVFAVNVSRPDPERGVVPVHSVELRIYDRERGEERPVFEEEWDGQIWTGEVFALRGTSLVLTQQLNDPGRDYSPEASRPELVDVDKSDRIPVLEAGDVVVGLVR